MNKKSLLLLYVSIFLLSTILQARAQDNQPPVANASGPYTGTEGVAIAFDGSGSYDPNGTIVSYFWDFGDGQKSSEENPAYIYAQDGTYTVTLTVTDDDSATDTDTTTATVADTGSTADFSGMPTSGDEPLTVIFTDLSASYDGITAWEWDFENDGVVDNTEQNPIHVYNQDGVYSVTLKVEEGDGDSSIETKVGYVTVTNTEPSADFSATPTSGGEPLQVSFTDTSTSYDGVVSWSWDFGDGETSTEQNPSHTYTQDGAYTVKLTVYEGDGDSATETKADYITVYDVVPPVTVHDYDGLWHTSDFTVTLTATDDLSGVAETYYKINDGPIKTVSADGHPRITTESANNILEYWSVDNAGNEEAHQIIPSIKLDKTNPTANAGPDQAVNEDTLMTFDGSASNDNIGITSYTWTFFDGTPQTLTGMKPEYTFNTPGNYTFTLNVTDAALNSATDTVIITVIDITKPIANAGDDQVVHEDVLVTFNGSGSTDNVEIASYVWTFIDVIPQTLLGVNSTYVFDVPATYNVTLTVSDAQGNSATDVVTLTVIDTTWPAANAGPDQVVDEDTLVNFDGSASSDNVGIITYIWMFTDGTLQTLFGVNPSYTFEAPSVYTVTLNVTDAEGHFTADTVVINVRDTTPPLVHAGNYATIVENAPLSLEASGSLDNVAVVDYQWDFGDGTFENSMIPSAIHTYTEPGVYIVALTILDEAGNLNGTSISVVVHRDTDGDLIADYIDTDDDNDGMPDYWEILHGLNPLDPSDASLDRDGDGFSNFTEHQIASDPNVYTSPSPFPLIVVLVIAIIGFIISLAVLVIRKL